jgi:hypothetical protein
VQIPFKELTKTFKDAIHTTRFLGLQYLWIDSLCILQDDPNDWIRESFSMSDVYGGATINIAASGAVDGSEGCFFDRHTSWRCQIRAMFKGKDFLFDCIPSRYHYSLKDAPLATRGWVTQERFLSRRTLHFTRNEIFWECHEKVASETFPERVPLWGAANGKELSLPKTPMTHAVWFNLAQEYSHCKLTFASDKLVAISGLARMFQAEVKDDYLAGLWKKDLKSQLLWEAVKPDERPLPPTAPSWSWASLRGPVTLKFFKRPALNTEQPSHLDIKLEQVNVIPFSPSNPFGEVSGGSLRISSRYLVAGILRDHEPANSSPEAYSLFRIGRRNCRVYPKFDTRSDFNIFITGGVKIYFLPVPRLDHDTNWLLGGLMIQETGKQRGQYRRIGCLLGFNELVKGLEEAFTERLSARKDEGSRLPNWKRGEDFRPGPVKKTKCVEIRVDEDRKKRYIIDLV